MFSYFGWMVLFTISGTEDDNCHVTKCLGTALVLSVLNHASGDSIASRMREIRGEG